MMEQREELQTLVQALSTIKNPQDIEKVLLDICTPKEFKNMQERWTICQLLHRKKTYRQIHSICGSSLTTITRVARFLTNENNGGYKILLEKKS